jgi:hypothetical protein
MTWPVCKGLRALTGVPGRSPVTGSLAPTNATCVPPGRNTSAPEGTRTGGVPPAIWKCTSPNMPGSNAPSLFGASTSTVREDKI